MSAEPSRGYRRSPTEVECDSPPGTVDDTEPGASVVGGADEVAGAGAVEGGGTVDCPADCSVDCSVGGTESLVRWAATATGCVGDAQAVNSTVHAATTAVSARVRRDEWRTGSGTAAGYPTAKTHKPRQSTAARCKVCSRSSSGALPT